MEEQHGSSTVMEEQHGGSTVMEEQHGGVRGKKLEEQPSFEKVDRKRGPARRAGECSPTAAHNSRHQHQTREAVGRTAQRWKTVWQWKSSTSMEKKVVVEQHSNG